MNAANIEKLMNVMTRNKTEKFEIRLVGLFDAAFFLLFFHFIHKMIERRRKEYNRSGIQQTN